MITIGLLKEGKVPPDNRVVFTPAQCRWVQQTYPGVQIIVQRSVHRCFTDKEYHRAGIMVSNDISDCTILMGIKEVPPDDLIAHKMYLLFSHTKKKQQHNQPLLHTIINHKITLIDYECLAHEDGQRIIGFGFFAGVVGAHNGMMAYGARTGSFTLDRVYKQKSFKKLMHTYFGLQLPTMKIAVTGSGRVAHGILEIMNLMGIIEVEAEEYISREFSYPVYVHLKGADLYQHKQERNYHRQHFHEHPEEYDCQFENYIPHTDVLLNGVYWDVNVPRLFEPGAVSGPSFRIQVIADVTDDAYGSIPINLGDQTIENPVYGVDKITLQKTPPYLPHSVDIMAVNNLPNELARDASRYFGEQLIKYVLPDLLYGHSAIIQRATIVKDGILTAPYQYLQQYAQGYL